jgi:hypothetical protein
MLHEDRERERRARRDMENPRRRARVFELPFGLA